MFGCFDDVKLKDIPKCSLPGEPKQPLATLWDTWLATSIFQRTDISLGEIIRLHREGVTCFDTSVLKDILKMAYEKCIDWTEFITNTQKIRKHGSIQRHYFERSYDETLRAIRDKVSKKRFAVDHKRRVPLVSWQAKAHQRSRRMVREAIS
ncbi:unnamed protein product [Heligmosomoides polygyrus]|uniref:Histone-fold-containing protein n=1 Tax=Heligmosomoides polygyrus TaxID=6339 RepID=A0A183FL53_HELPZ|nr:unnamed protein product [Heligmosomoides polygyrus]